MSIPQIFRPPIPWTKVVKGETLTANKKKRLQIDFPVGGFYHETMLVFHIALTTGSESGEYTDGELKIIKGITYESPNSEKFVDDVPGLALYYLAKALSGKGTSPHKNAIASGSSATFDVFIPIMHADHDSDNPRDTVIDTRRYDNLALTVDLGGVSDLFATVGTASIAVTLDVYVREEVGPGLPERPKAGTALSAWPAGYPIGYRELSCTYPINPSSDSVIKLPRASDLLIQRVLIGTANSVTSGVKFDGTFASSIIATVKELRDVRKAWVDDLPEEDLRYFNQWDYGMETGLTGLYLLDFLGRYGSIANAIQANPELTARLDLSFTFDTLSTSGITALVDGIRFLRA